MVKVLLTSVFKPFGSKDKYSKDGLNSKHSLAENFHNQITQEQDIFSLREVYGVYALDLIAKNLNVPAKVIHYPSLKKFKKELKKNYDFVGINFCIATWGKAKLMCKLVREISPDTKIVLGGYGVKWKECKKYADYICEKEGVSFFRELINDKRKDIEMTYGVTSGHVMGFPSPKRIHLTVNLGCPNGCDFCTTSHFFQRKTVNFFNSGKELYKFLKKAEKETGVGDFTFFSEDFLLNKKFVDEFGKEAIRNKDKIRFNCFSSLKALTQYDFDYLVGIGLDSIWVGIESFNKCFKKLAKVDIHKTISNLKSRGISTLGSYILGLDYQTENILRDELREFLKLNCDASQFIISIPSPGTPLWDHLKKEDRLFPNIKSCEVNGFSLIFKHKHLSKNFLESFQDFCYEMDYKVNGPTIFRYIKTNMNGYLRYKDSKNPLLRKRASQFYKSLKNPSPLLPAMAYFAPSKKVKSEINNLIKNMRNNHNIKQNKVLTVLLVIWALFYRSTFAKKQIFWPKTKTRLYNKNT